MTGTTTEQAQFLLDQMPNTESKLLEAFRRKFGHGQLSHDKREAWKIAVEVNTKAKNILTDLIVRGKVFVSEQWAKDGSRVTKRTWSRA